MDTFLGKKIKIGLARSMMREILRSKYSGDSSHYKEIDNICELIPQDEVIGKFVYNAYNDLIKNNKLQIIIQNNKDEFRLGEKLEMIFYKLI